MSAQLPELLGLVLYWLYHINLKKFTGFSPERLASIKGGYLRDRLPRLLDALAWALNNPGTDFAALLPELGYTNEQILNYFVIVRRQLAEES